MYRGNGLKSELEKFAGDSAKKREEGLFKGVGGWYLDAHSDLIMVHAGT